MANERDLTRKCLEWMARHHPDIWVLKTQSQGMQRAGVWDLLLCRDSVMMAVELKHPEEPSFHLAPRQEIEGEWMARAGVKLLCTNDLEDFKRFVNSGGLIVPLKEIEKSL